MKYVISGDKTGKTYGVYKIEDWEVMPFSNQEPIVKGLKTFREAQRKIKELEKKK